MAKEGGNPQEFLRCGVEPVASKPVAVKLPISIDEFVRSLPNKSEWLRKVIAEAAKAEMENAS